MAKKFAKKAEAKPTAEPKKLSGKGIFLVDCSVDGVGSFKAGAKYDAAKFSKEDNKALKQMGIVE